LPSRTPDEDAELADLMSRLTPYLDVDLANTTEAELKGNIEAANDNLSYINRSVWDMYMRANQLAALPTLTPSEQTELTQILGLLAPYLDTDLGSTTEAELLENLALAQPQTFGLPVRGLAIDTNHRPQITAGASFVEAMSMQVADFGAPFDEFGYDSLVYDEQDDQLAIISVHGLPPIPNTGMPSGAWVDYQTNLEGFGRVIRVTFDQTLPPNFPTPNFYVWESLSTSPVRVTSTIRVDNRTYEFSIPQASNFKLVVL
jgi:hypothetical protein